MSHTFDIHEKLNLLVISFTGLTSYDEELKAIIEIIKDSPLKPDMRILMDRSKAQMAATPENICPYIELILKNLSMLGKPRIATVVSSDRDYGMMRMRQLRYEFSIPPEFAVFRSLEEACLWLGVEPSLVDSRVSHD